MSAQPLCVVHLVRAANGIQPLCAFLDSYRAHPAGIPHVLLIVFKGYQEPLPDDYEKALLGIPHGRHFMPDVGYDIDIYFNVIRDFPHQVFCFLNSYSVILVDGWLQMLYRALSQEGAGMVGATGSWQSLVAGLPSEIAMPRSVQSTHPLWKRVLLRRFPFLRKVRPWMYRRLLRGQFDPFPNCHLRTNAFMLARDVALDVKFIPTRNKFDAYRFESGRGGLTHQVRAMGRRALVVARDGQVFEMTDWYRSNTFWRSNQENLLVADNQTRRFDGLDRDGRLVLSYQAWGPNADPG